uniref:Uncharacterized protein n=1 Tax=Bionectria ochroleuca TaxID=29856 RepID=A0A0B7KJI3_BIOOC
MDDQLRLVYRCLDADLSDNALFLASVLHVLDPENGTWAHLKSLACLRLGQYGLARQYSCENGLTGEHLGCSYVFALASLSQGNYLEGISALERAKPHWQLRNRDASAPLAPDPLTQRFWPDRPAVNCLLAKLHRYNKDNKNAAIHFTEALELDPLMWDALTNLCDIGATLNIPNIFNVERFHPEPTSKPDRTGSKSVVANAATRQTPPYPEQPSSYNTRTPPRGVNIQNVSLRKKNEKPTNDTDKIKTTLPKKRQRPGFDHSTEQPNPHSGPILAETDIFTSRTTAPTPSLGTQRRSARLHNRIATTSGLADRPAFQPSTREALRRPAKPTTLVRDRQKPAATATARPGPAHKRTLPQRKAAVSPTPTPETDPSTKLESIRVEAIAERERTVRLLGIFQSLGVAYQSLSKYEPRACLDAFGSLPIELQATPWVLSKSARAQYELMDYKKAKQTFQALRKRAPSWIEDLEVYSTVLWHLKDEVPLSLLAHELTESHFQSPETWCAVGNSFSVCRSRDEAIRCFRRACQLSPQLPQTYSLLGYELMEQEDYYEAIGAFQRAIRVEPRFYTAWVGLGRAYERLSRNDVALKHYLTAVEINSSNPIIYTYVARVLETLQKRRSAIEYLRRGIRLSPPPLTMALIRMQRAGIYLYAGQPGAALEDLRAVALIAPDEPRVHLLLGQAYAMQGEDKAAALKSYTTALSLAPWSREIKDAMLSLEDE